MLEINNLCIKLNDHYLVKNLSFTLNAGDKLAIIGEEGNGKSTLLKSILGMNDYAMVSGTINFKKNRIGYLEQFINESLLQQTVYQYLFLDDFSYYEKITSLYKNLDLIGLEDSILHQILNTLSGGEKIKIQLLKLLIEEYDILFLDEPTNDLDIDTLEWLEKFINQTKKPIIYVSHDETLLSNTANMILHLEQIKKKTECRHTLLRINYDTYVKQRLRLLDKQTQIAKSEKREFHKQQENLQRIMQKVEHRQNTISRKYPYEAQALKRKMHSLKSQEKRLNQTELTEIPDVEEQIHFFFEEVTLPQNKQIIHLDIPELTVKEKLLSKNIRLDIIGNTHLCIVGKNGIGKSTLIKMIYEELKNRTDIKIGYMPQSYEDILNRYEYVLDFLAPEGDKQNITKARMYLGDMKFTKEEMTCQIKELSNGTKAKLFLIKFVLDQCNVLILDEPTRNVSPLSNPVIRNVLKNYQGTIISVSHDRNYMKEVIDQLYVLTKDGLKGTNHF